MVKGTTGRNHPYPLDPEKIITVPWERIKGESARKYEYFTTYRDMRKHRSLNKASKLHNRTRALFEKWSVEQHWVERVLAFEDHMSKVSIVAQENVAKEMAERHVRFALLIQEKVIMRLKSMPIEKLSTRELANLADIAVKMERTALGEPSEIMQHNNSYLQEVKNIYQDIKVINADPDALERAITRWEALTGATGPGAIESSVDGAYAESE